MMHRALILSLLALAPSLSGCGFSPLYAESGAAGVGAELSDVSLLELTGPADASRAFSESFAAALPSSVTKDGRYTLEIELRDRRQAIAVTAAAFTRRFDYSLTARYTLTDTQSGKTRRQSIDTLVSYGVVPSMYASKVAREDAVRRAADELARKLELDIALYLKGRAPNNQLIERIDVNGGANAIIDEVQDPNQQEEESEDE